MQKNNQTINPSTPALKIAEKYNYQSYTKWFRINIAIEGKERLNHINVVPPQTTNPSYSQCKQRDFVVLSWIISNIETK